MAISLDIKLKRANKVYFEDEIMYGLIEINTPAEFKYDAITLLVEGTVNLQLSPKNQGIFEAFYNSVKPIQIINSTIDVANSGKIPAGLTEIPFEIPLKSTRSNQPLYETYHGVYINITYSLKCVIKRGFLAKDLLKIAEFFVQTKPTEEIAEQPLPFTITPKTIQHREPGEVIPDFSISGVLNSTVCPVTKPFSGQITVTKSAVCVKSIELQLVRVETCGCAEGFSRDATEVQNIQIGDGDVPQNLQIPIHMIFPRLFTCPTLSTTNFKIEFEINVVVAFENDWLVTESFPIILVRNSS